MDLQKRFQAIFACHEKNYDYMEIRLEEVEETGIQIRQSELVSLSVNLDQGGNVRVLKNGGWGFAVFNDLADLEEMAEYAVNQANLAGRGVSKFAEVEPIQDEISYQEAGDPRKVSLKEKVALMKSYCQIIDSYGKPITMSRVRYGDEVKKVIFANSEGTYISQESCDINGIAMAYASEGDKTESYYHGFGSIQGFDDVKGLEEDMHKLCQTVNDILQAPLLKGGQYTVILDSDMTGLFTHEAFGHLSEADFIADDENLMETMKLGRVFGSKELNIYDGPTPNRRGTFKYDDEGVPTKRAYLIKEGKLVGRLHSRESAAKMEEEPTGNARAISYQYPPIVRMRTTAIEGGEHTLEEMISSIDDGVYMVGARGGKTGGENFSFTSSYGYKIKDGKLDHMIKGVTLTGNVFTTLKNIDMIGNDESTPNFPWACGKGGQRGLAVTQGGPHIRIQNVNIGGE